MLALFSALILAPFASPIGTQSYQWKNVKIGGGGGFVPDIIFNPTKQGLVYARTDIGGAYRMNSNGSWTPLLDWVDDSRWNHWGCDALATDPLDPSRLYLVRDVFLRTLNVNPDLHRTWTGCWDVHQRVGPK